MMKRIFSLFVCLVTGTLFSVPLTETQTEGVCVRMVEDASAVTERDYDPSYPCCIFYQQIPQKQGINLVWNVFQNTFSSNASSVPETRLYGKFFYPLASGALCAGYLLGTQDTTAARLQEMIGNVKEEMKRGVSAYSANVTGDAYGSVLQVGSDWSLCKAERYDMSLDSGSDHYGYVSEWNTKYSLCSGEYLYYLFGHETYLAPNHENTGIYRMSHLEYIFQADHPKVLLRNYEPKMKNPSTTLSYGWSAGGSMNGGVSCGYTTLADSPFLRDRGVMALDKVHLDFEYLKADTNDAPYYAYNVGQTMQTSVYIVREEDDNMDIVRMEDKRKITILKKGFLGWNTEKTFTYTITHKI